jgi:ATP adenylyltransferase
MRALHKTSKPDGFNFGANVGRAAGAGIDKHVHFHLVPRWNGDTNFMPVLSEIKVVSEHLQDSWKKLRQELMSKK